MQRTHLYGSKSSLLFQTPLCPPLRPTRAIHSSRQTPPICAKTGTPIKYPSKKPYGYWKHLPNVLLELQVYMSSLTPQPATMPTARELSLADRQDLAGAIRRHTWRKVAAAANLTLSSHARPRSLNLSFCTKLQTTRIHPYMYWRDWENVELEIRQFIRQRAKGRNRPITEELLIMPTIAELVDHGRSDLKRAISLHGGVRDVAKRLRLVPKSRPADYWNEERVIEETRRVMQCTRKTDDFPDAEDIRKFGQRGLLSAVRRLGGSRTFAKRMRLTVRSKSPKR